MSGHHSCMQMLQLFDIPNMQGLQGARNTSAETKFFKKSSKKTCTSIKQINFP